MLKLMNSTMLDWFTKWDTIFVTNWGKYYKVRQLYYKMGQPLLQTRAISRYYRIGEDLLKSGESFLQSEAGITNWSNYYEV